MSLDATFYGFATLADAKAAWHQQLARILTTMLTVASSSTRCCHHRLESADRQPMVPRLQSSGRLASARGRPIASSYWQTTTGESYLLEPAATDDFAQQLALGITKHIGLMQSERQDDRRCHRRGGHDRRCAGHRYGRGVACNELAPGVAWNEFRRSSI